MNKRQLDRYCDDVLRILYKNRNEDPMLFGVGDFRGGGEIADDLFVGINISEEDSRTVVQALKDVYGYIETDAKEKKQYYDLDKKENILSAVYAIKITDAGKYFIQTTSFTKESRWKNFDKWTPAIPNIVGTAAVLIATFACFISYRDVKKKREELQLQSQELQKIKAEQGRLIMRIDSFLTHNPRAHLPG